MPPWNEPHVREAALPDGRPALQNPNRYPFNLSRPWSFPAGHPDSVQCRRHERRNVQVRVELVFYRPDGEFYDRGTGVLRDLSLSGARLSDVLLAHGRLLAPRFGVGLRPAQEPPGDPEVAGRILRTFSHRMPGFGIEFLAPGSGTAERFSKIP